MDREEFEDFYRSTYHQMNQFAFGMLKDEGLCEDVLADSYIVVWQNRDKLHTYNSIPAFLYTVVRNACLVKLNKRKVVRKAEKEIAFLWPTAEEIKDDLVHLSLIASSELPPEMKKVFELIYIEGFTTFETAKILGRSIHTVRTQRLIAIQKIRKILKRNDLLFLLAALT